MTRVKNNRVRLIITKDTSYNSTGIYSVGQIWQPLDIRMKSDKIPLARYYGYPMDLVRYVFNELSGNLQIKSDIANYRTMSFCSIKDLPRDGTSFVIIDHPEGSYGSIEMTYSKEVLNVSFERESMFTNEEMIKTVVKIFIVLVRMLSNRYAFDRRMGIEAAIETVSLSEDRDPERYNEKEMAYRNCEALMRPEYMEELKELPTGRFYTLEDSMYLLLHVHRSV